MKTSFLVVNVSLHGIFLYNIAVVLAVLFSYIFHGRLQYLCRCLFFITGIISRTGFEHMFKKCILNLRGNFLNKFKG